MHYHLDNICDGCTHILFYKAGRWLNVVQALDLEAASCVKEGRQELLWHIHLQKVKQWKNLSVICFICTTTKISLSSGDSVCWPYISAVRVVWMKSWSCIKVCIKVGRIFLQTIHVQCRSSHVCAHYSINNHPSVIVIFFLSSPMPFCPEEVGFNKWAGNRILLNSRIQMIPLWRVLHFYVEPSEVRI